MRQEYEQYKQLDPYVKTYMQHAGEFGQWYQNRNKPQEAPKKDVPWYQEFWNPPEYNPHWLSQVETDANGNLVPARGAPPDVVAKLAQYRQFRAEQMEKFISNPPGYFEPIIDRRVEHIARKIVEEQLSGYRQQVSSQQFIEQNAPWLFEKDASGNIKQDSVFDPATGQFTTQRALTPWGHKFRQYISQEASRQAQRGYEDLEEQKKNAMNQVAIEYLTAQMMQKPAPQVPQAPQQSALQKSNSQFLSQQGTFQVPQHGNSVPAETPVTSQNLYHEMLAAAQAAGGVT